MYFCLCCSSAFVVIRTNFSHATGNSIFSYHVRILISNLIIPILLKPKTLNSNYITDISIRILSEWFSGPGGLTWLPIIKFKVLDPGESWRKLLVYIGMNRKSRNNSGILYLETYHWSLPYWKSIPLNITQRLPTPTSVCPRRSCVRQQRRLGDGRRGPGAGLRVRVPRQAKRRLRLRAAGGPDRAERAGGVRRHQGDDCGGTRAQVPVRRLDRLSRIAKDATVVTVDG